MVVHYIDSCVPLGNLGCVRRDRDPLDGREKQREVLGDREESEGLALLGCPAPEARG